MIRHCIYHILIKKCYNKELRAKFDVPRSWFKCNYLRINESKTKVSLLYDNPPYYELIADCTRPPLQVVRCIKLLGPTIDSSLKLKSMCNKENDVKVAALRRVRKTISPEVMVNICKTFILPHFGYCAPVLAVIMDKSS